MKKIRINSIISLCIIFFSTSYISVFAETSTSIKNEIEANKEVINEIEEEKNRVKEQKEAHDSELDSLFEKIDAKGQELLEAEKDVEKFQVKIDKLQEEIDTIQKTIDDAKEEIEQKEKLITQKEEELAETQGMLDQRIRSYYKMNITSQYIYMILKSDGIGQLLSNIQSIARVINIDRELMDNIKKVQKELLVEQENLQKRIAKEQKDKEDLSVKQSEIVEAQKEFIVIKEAKQSQMDELLALEAEKENIIAALTEEELALQEKMGDLVAYNQELQAELDNIFNSINSSNNNSGGGGNPDVSNGEGFLRPTNGPVTDPFGGRTNPVTGEPGMHNGVDFGDPYGTPIAASKSGVVTYAGWISGYGNSVIIDHGGGVTTLYGHAESLNVSVGQQVTRGETVAFVGSTGQSTGPHLHFEIRFNNVPQNPMDYV